MATENGAPALRCTGLRKRFGELVAVDGVDLLVRRGECFGLLGPNGAGKTTTLEMLEGLQTADAGEIEILGEHWGRGDDRALRERIGIQLQQAELGEKLTVEEAVRLFRSLYSRGRTVEDVLARLDLGSKRKGRIEKLSGGQKQRLAVATALVGDPELLFLDEPTTGLDPQARLRLWDIVDEFRKGGGTIVMTTHSMEEAARLCDRLAIMDQGRVIALGSPAELVASLGAEQIIEFETVGAGAGARSGSGSGSASASDSDSDSASVSVSGSRSGTDSDTGSASGAASVSAAVSAAASGPAHARTGTPDVPDDVLQQLPGVQSVSRRLDRTVLIVSELNRALPALMAELDRRGVVLSAVATHQATLEDVFIRLTGKGLRDE